MGVEKAKPNPLNLLVKTDVGSIQTRLLLFEAFLMREGLFYCNDPTTEYDTSLRGDSKRIKVRMRVEKVKPDPLNLLVKTDVGKQNICFEDDGASIFYAKRPIFINIGMLSVSPEGSPIFF